MLIFVAAKNYSKFRAVGLHNFLRRRIGGNGKNLCGTTQVICRYEQQLNR